MKHIRLGSRQLAALQFLYAVYRNNPESWHSFDNTVKRELQSLAAHGAIELSDISQQARLRPVPLTFALIRNHGRCNY